MNTIVYLIRHGSTEWTEEDRFSGISDIPLSTTGLHQAQMLSQSIFRSSIQIESIYSSPLKRCIETANAISNCYNISSQILNEFRELDYGVWEGLSRREIISDYYNDFQAWQENPFLNSPTGGESGKEVIKRVLPIFKGLMQKHKGQAFVIVAHKALNRLILCWALGIPYENYRKKLVQHPACINVLKITDDENISLIKLNDTSHYTNTLMAESN